MLRTPELGRVGDLVPEMPSEPVQEPPIPTTAEDISSRPAEKTRPSHRRLRRSLLASVALLGASSALTIPESAPLHARASLLTELAGSDLESTLLGGAPASAGQDAIDENYNYIQSNFSLGNGIYKENSNGTSWFAPTWSMTRWIEALGLMCEVPGKSAYCATYHQDLNTVNNDNWSKAGYNQGLDDFHSALTPPENDDSLWMGIINMRDYGHTKNPAELQRGIDVMNIVIGQWDEKDGGIYWMRQTETADDHDRALVSNAPAVILGVELYQRLEKDPKTRPEAQRFLRWSEKIMDWIVKALRDPQTGFYGDHVSPDGTVDTTIYTYGQGITAAAMAALSLAEPEKYPLQNAVSLIEGSLDYFDTPGLYNNPAFEQIFFFAAKWIAALYNNPDFAARVQLSLDEAIDSEPNDPSNLLFAAGEAGLQVITKITSNTALTLYASPLVHKPGRNRSTKLMTASDK